MMAEIVWLLVVVLLVGIGPSVSAAVADAADGIEVRVLRDTEEFDHDLCRRLAGEAYPALPTKHAIWPMLWPDAESYRQNETLVAVVDGLIVGRAILEARYHPYCEFVNLAVRQDYRNQGVATAIVRQAIVRARSMGSKYMLLQESLQDAQAQGIYLKAGFLPATRGQMQRMIRLLDAPVVSNFLTAHPGAAFTSEAAADLGERWWRLAWQDAGQSVALYLHGGSCQGDSDGLQPMVQACDLVDAGMSISVRVDLSDTQIMPGGMVEETMTVRNNAPEPFRGLVRAVLLPGTEIALEAPPVPVELASGKEQLVSFAIRTKETGEEFDLARRGFLSYRSIPLTLELCWEGGSVLLSAAAKTQ
jgi:ribosomal protein S18 acetylase RimI-like enzyme